MKFTPTSPVADTGGLLATDVALVRIGGVLDSIDHQARARLDAETRVGLVQAVAEVGRRLDALKVVLVGEAEQHQAAQTARGTSLRSVLAATGQVTPGEAASWGYAAKSLAGRDRVQAAALAGAVSIQQARAIDTVLTELPPGLDDAQREQAERVLLGKAETLDAKTLATQGRVVLEEVAPEIDAVSDELERLDAQRRKAHAARGFSMIPDGCGSILLRGQLPVLEATPLQQLVAAYVESDRRAHHHDKDQLDPLTPSRTPEQRRADALIGIVNSQVAGLQAAGYLPKPVAKHTAEPTTGNQTESIVHNLPQPDAGDHTQSSTHGQAGSTAGHQAGSVIRNQTESNADNRLEPTTHNPAQSDAGHQADSATRNFPESTADQLPITDPHVTHEPMSLARRNSPPATNQTGRVPLVAGDRPRVSVMMGYQQLKDHAEQAGLLPDGTKITASELRQLLCDAELVPVVLGTNSEILDVGRAQRLVTPTIRRALTLRDGGCAFPGCNTPDTGCEAHHVDPWWNGGPTALNNLVLLCPHHHGTIEPTRFFNQTGTPKWQVRIAEDGHPEFQPPTRNGTKPKPIRHHRTQQHTQPQTGRTPPTKTGNSRRLRDRNKRHQQQHE